MKEKVNKLEAKNSNLELRVEELETKCKVSENVTSMLVLEVDRHSQQVECCYQKYVSARKRVSGAIK